MLNNIYLIKNKKTGLNLKDINNVFLLLLDWRLKLSGNMRYILKSSCSHE